VLVFLADDVVMFPFKSLFKVFKEIYNAAMQEMAAEADSIRTELSQLYLALEAGTLSEEAFDARERELLDRLDVIEEQGRAENAGGANEEDEDEDEDDEETEDDEDEDDEEEEDDQDDEDDGNGYQYEQSDDTDESSG
jgi:Gas vesicle protein G